MIDFCLPKELEDKLRLFLFGVMSSSVVGNTSKFRVGIFLIVFFIPIATLLHAKDRVPVMIK